MNEKAKILLKNLNYTVSANFLVLGISVVLNLVVPKFIGVKEYSFWQLYVFYSSYVGFFHFGWLDGIYLKIGGAEYEDLDKRNLGTQFWYLAIFQTFLAILVALSSLFLTFSFDRKIILIITALNLVLTNCKYFVLYIMQSTNRIKEYAQASRGDRYFYIVGVIIYIFLQGKSFIPLIILDVISKLIVLIWGLYRIKDMLFVKFMSFKETLYEIVDNIKVGMNLMISNIASMLILGISRIMVERQWSIETFGKLSFTLSISNMFMTFINAVGIVLFPLLRRTKKENLSVLYISLRAILVPVTYGFLLFYIPMKIVLNVWLPDYAQSLEFMGILFPIVIYEGRMALLVSTYLKVIRKEKLILVANILTLIISSFLSFIAVFIVKNIHLSVFMIIFSLAFRCIVSEKLLLSVMSINLNWLIIIESFLSSVFIIANTFCSQWTSFFVYLICFILFIFFNKNRISDGVRVLKKLAKE